MTEEKMMEVLADTITPNRGLYCCGPDYLSWVPGDDSATLDGQFDADDLEAIAAWMRANGEPPVAGPEDDHPSLADGG